jgi:signal transduction histidine kinase
MRRLSLSTVLIALNVGLVLTAVLCVVGVATGELRRLADREALARVNMAGSAALKTVELTGRDLLTSAQVLAERPTLARLLGEGDAPTLRAYLDRFRRTSHLAGCAVMVQGKLFAHGGPPMRWEEIASRLGTKRERDAAVPAERRVLLPGAGVGPLVLGASCPVATRHDANVIVARLLDEEFLREASEEIGLPIVIFGRDGSAASSKEIPSSGRTPSSVSEAAGPRGSSSVTPQVSGGGLSDRGKAELEALRTEAIDSEEAVARRLDAPGLYAVALPLRAPSGEMVGLLQTTLPGGGIDSSVRGVSRGLLVLSLGVGALATVFSVLLGRRLVRPLNALTKASVRFGRGDFSVPVPRTPGAEIGDLASTMEEMRRGLLHLTADLRRQQAEMEAILTGIAEGVFAVDGQRRIRYLNPQAAALIGVRAEEAIGRFCGDVLDPEGPGGVRPCEERCPILDARFRGSARATEHLRLASGARRTVVITSAPMDAGGQEAGTADRGARQFQVMRDETEIEATRRLRDAVLANISHEFRTPLAAQLASIELLGDRIGELTTDETRTLVLALERGTLRLTQLIDNLLESVRIESGRDSIRRQAVALDEVVEEAVEVTSPLLALRDQKLSVELPYPLPGILGDAPRLVQVLVNLLANANKFAPAGSTVSMGGDVTESEITLWVEDEGPGLPPGAVASLFERFVRTSGEGDEMEDEPEQNGMGLGLWIVKSIVERHGGRVEVRSRGSATSRGGELRPAPDQGGGPSADALSEENSGAARPGSPRGIADRDGGGRIAAGASRVNGTRMCVILPRESADHENPRRR